MREGAFYHFFSSKELLVYSIAPRFPERPNTRIDFLMDTKRYLDREDVQTLITWLPENCRMGCADIKAEIEHDLGCVRD